MIVSASDFIHADENAVTVFLDGVPVTAIWAKPTLLGSHDQLMEKLVIHIDVEEHASPSGASVMFDSENYIVESSKKVARNTMWKLVLSDDT